MSRTAAATNGKLWVWSDNDNPGAGTKGVTKAAGGTGLNANWESLDAGVFTDHNDNGTHKNDVIHGANINADAVDNSTLEVSAATGTKTLRVKNGGITMAKINQASATTGQAIVWNGSAWAPGAPTAVLSDGYITRAKLATYVGHSSHDLDLRKAGTSAGNTPAAATTWAETSASQVNKIQTNFVYSQQCKYLEVIGEMKSAGLGSSVTVQATVADLTGASPISDSIGDASGTWTPFVIVLDLSSYGAYDGLERQLTISMASGSGSAGMRNVIWVQRPA